jgi:SpoVK/Ycf46/Vps4 family AAA+-type ATPase
VLIKRKEKEMEKILKSDMAAIKALNVKYLSNLLNYTQKIADQNMLELILPFLPLQLKENIIEEIKTYAEKRRIDIESTINLFRERGQNENETISDLLDINPIRRHFQKQIIREFTRLNPSDPFYEKSEFYKKAAEISKIFNMDRIDTEIIVLIYLTEIIDTTEKIADSLSEFDGRLRRTRFSSNLDPRSIAILLNYNYTVISRHLQNSGLLKKTGIIDSDNDLNEEIHYYIDGMSSTPLLQKFYYEYSGRTLPLSELSVKSEELRILRMLYENRPAGKGVNILLYGEPGTGKTEFARAFGKMMSRHTYEISNATDEDNYKRRRSDNRAIALKACQARIQNDRSLIIIDEADSMLGAVSGFNFFFTPDSEKGEVNNLLDQTTTYNIWISNNINGINESTLRRFDYSLYFEPFSLTEREKIWKNLIKKENLEKYFSDETISMLAERYKINASGISTALRHTVNGVSRQTAAEDFLSVLESFLAKHNRLIKGRDIIPDNKKSFSPQYTLDGLNIRGNIKNALDTAALFNKSLLNPNKANDFPLQNINFLLYGPPGTGKTEFAKYLARKLKRPLIIKTASDILSMWVGGSEQNIAGAFKEAQRDKAVLLIDEVDSLLYSRQDASKSWELSQVNELLTQMEKFRGIFIASTNMKNLMDSAAIRRFNFKLMFDYLNSSGSEKFYEIFLQPLVKGPMDEWQKRRLRGLKLLTPGDFKNVYQQNILLAQDISHDKLLDDLTVEVSLKNEKTAKIGFVN